MRPRNSLTAFFPGLTREEASVALREAAGDLEDAKRAISASRRLADGEVAAAGAARKDPTISESSSSNDAKTPAFPAPRIPPRSISSINNLSDRQYCCVWHVEVYEDGYRPDVARALLASVARHVNPILRSRGWRVKRLIESEAKKWIGLCTSNGRNDADAASTNIQLNLRVQPNRRCTRFRTFRQVLAVMLHEITHTSIGLEDIHPPAFYELLDEIKADYRTKLAGGEVDAETDDYGCLGTYVTDAGELTTVAWSAADVLGNAGIALETLGSRDEEEECGASRSRKRMTGWKSKRRRGGAGGYISNIPREKRRPLLKGAKMIDRRTKTGRAAMEQRHGMSARELAAQAALDRRAGGISSSAATYSGGNVKGENAQEGKPGREVYIDNSDDEDNGNGILGAGEKTESSDAVLYDSDEEDDLISPHEGSCGCRSCLWDEELFDPEK